MLAMKRRPSSLGRTRQRPRLARCEFPVRLGQIRRPRRRVRKTAAGLGLGRSAGQKRADRAGWVPAITSEVNADLAEAEANISYGRNEVVPVTPEPEPVIVEPEPEAVPPPAPAKSAIEKYLPWAAVALLFLK